MCLVLLSGSFKPKKGQVYGLSSAQHREATPFERFQSSLNHNLDLELHMFNLESRFQAIRADVGEVQEDIASMKEDMTTTRVTTNQLLHNILAQLEASPPSTITQAHVPRTHQRVQPFSA